MKVIKKMFFVPVIFLLSITLPFHAIAQGEHPAFELICPDLSETQPSVVDCKEENEMYGKNHIRNMKFNVDLNAIQNNTYDVRNPFALGQIPNWVETHGSPALSNFLSPTTSPPPGFDNYVSMYSWSAEEQVMGEGIAQVIPQVAQGKHYKLSFFKKLADESFRFENSMHKFYVVLMHCKDYESIHNYPSYGTPSLPAASQIIYLESVGNEEWDQVLTGFVAEDDYDMIWIFPRQHSSVTEILGVDLTGVVLTPDFANGDFQCTQTLSLPGCNFIPNPGFELSDLNLPLLGAFALNNVADWNDSHGSSDINRFGTTFSHGNFASMAVGAHVFNGQVILPSYEGIVAKIKPLQQSRKYALSFFISSTQITTPAPNVVFNVALIKCDNFPNASSGYVVPALSNPHQKIYCESITAVGNTGWRQVFISFEAADDFDMIRIYPEQPQVPASNCESFIHFGYPELIDVTDFDAGIVSGVSCNHTLGPVTPNCSVTNAVFTWKDPNGTIIYQGPNQNINISQPPNLPGNYTLSMTVPGATIINCDNVTTNIIDIVNVPYLCNCGTLQIENFPTAGYFSTYNPSWRVENLSQCSMTSLCNTNEWIEVSASSNQMTGNIWEVYITSFTGTGLTYFNEYTNVSTNPIATTKDVNIDFVPDPGGYGIIEIRLTNTNLNETKSLFFRIIPYSYIHNVCYSSTYSGYNKLIGIGENPYSSYLWTFPSGMTLQPSNAVLQVAYNESQYTGPSPINATLQVTNTFGCPNYTQALTLYPNQPLYCNARVISSNNFPAVNDNQQNFPDEIKTTLYPNPVVSNLNIKTDKSVEEICVLSLDGKILLKQLALGKNNIISLKNLNQGYYFLKLFYKDKTIETKLIMKQ